MENLHLCAYHSGMKCQVRIEEQILMILAGDYPDWSASHEWFRLCYFYGGNTHAILHWGFQRLSIPQSLDEEGAIVYFYGYGI